MHSTWATRRHAVAADLAPRLKGLNITTDLMQVGKVVTGQQLEHHRQGLRATLIMLPAAFEVVLFAFHAGPVAATLLGMLTGIGGGMVRVTSL